MAPMCTDSHARAHQYAKTRPAPTSFARGRKPRRRQAALAWNSDGDIELLEAIPAWSARPRQRSVLRRHGFGNMIELQGSARRTEPICEFRHIAGLTEAPHARNTTSSLRDQRAPWSTTSLTSGANTSVSRTKPGTPGYGTNMAGAAGAAGPQAYLDDGQHRRASVTRPHFHPTNQLSNCSSAARDEWARFRVDRGRPCNTPAASHPNTARSNFFSRTKASDVFSRLTHKTGKSGHQILLTALRRREPLLVKGQQLPSARHRDARGDSPSTRR